MTTKLLHEPSPRGDGDGNTDASSLFDLTQRRANVDWEFLAIEQRHTTLNMTREPLGTVGLFVPSQAIELVVDVFPFNYVGRSYPYSEHFDGIDFSAFGAYKLGVSRQHAALVKQEDALLLIDNCSTNGTYLNLSLLESHCPYVVENDDVVRLGAFEVVIKLQ